MAHGPARARSIQHLLAVEGVLEPHHDRTLSLCPYRDPPQRCCPLHRTVASLDPDQALSRRAQIIHSSRSDEPPVVDDGDVVADPLDELELVAGENDCGASRHLTFQHVAHEIDAHRIEAREGLVQNQQIGVVHQRHRELNTLLIAE